MDDYDTFTDLRARRVIEMNNGLVSPGKLRNYAWKLAQRQANELDLRNEPKTEPVPVRKKAGAALSDPY